MRGRFIFHIFISFIGRAYKAAIIVTESRRWEAERQLNYVFYQHDIDRLMQVCLLVYRIMRVNTIN